jgi:hypothetical protein
MSIYDFKTNFNKSNTDSLLVMDYFKSLEYEVIDYTDNLDKQINDKVDFGIRKNNKEYTDIEFKTCNVISKTKNIAYELIGNFLNRKLGSCLSTKAKFLFYYDNVNKILRIFDIEKLNQAINNSDISNWKVAKASSNNKTSGTYCSFSLLIPIDFLQKNSKEISYFEYNLTSFISKSK